MIQIDSGDGNAALENVVTDSEDDDEDLAETVFTEVGGYRRCMSWRERKEVGGGGSMVVGAAEGGKGERRPF